MINYYFGSGLNVLVRYIEYNWLVTFVYLITLQIYNNLTRSNIIIIKRRYLKEVENIGELVVESDCTLDQSQYINNLLYKLCTTIEYAIWQENCVESKDDKFPIHHVIQSALSIIQ